MFYDYDDKFVDSRRHSFQSEIVNFLISFKRFQVGTVLIDQRYASLNVLDQYYPETFAIEKKIKYYILEFMISGN